MSNSNQKRKSKLNMTTKDPSRKQIIISIITNNIERVIVQSNTHMSNINRLLKDIKSEIYANFICSNNRSIIITTNNITSTLDMQTIEKYIKNLNNIDSNEIMNSRLPQSKSYLNWKEGNIWFTRYPGSYRMKYQDIEFKTRRI